MMGLLNAVRFGWVILLYTNNKVTLSYCEKDWHCYVNGITEQILLSDRRSISSMDTWLQLGVEISQHFTSLCSVQEAPWLRSKLVYIEQYSSMPCKLTCMEAALVDSTDNLTWSLVTNINTSTNSIWNFTVLFIKGANCAYYQHNPYNQVSLFKLTPPWPSNVACNNVRPFVYLVYSSVALLKASFNFDMSNRINFCFRQLILQNGDLETRSPQIAQRFNGKLDPLPSLVMFEKENVRLNWDFKTDLGRYVSLLFSINRTVDNFLDFQLKNMLVLSETSSGNVSQIQCVSTKFKMSVIVLYRKTQHVNFRMLYTSPPMCFSSVYPGCCKDILVSNDTPTHIEHTTSHSPYCMIKLHTNIPRSTVELQFKSIIMEDISMQRECSGGIGVLFHTHTPPMATLCRTFQPGRPDYWKNDRPFVVSSILSMLLLVVYITEDYGKVSLTADVRLSYCHGFVNPWNIDWKLAQKLAQNFLPEFSQIGINLTYIEPMTKTHHRWENILFQSARYHLLEINIQSELCFALHILPQQERASTFPVEHIILFNNQYRHKRMKLNVVILGNKTDFHVKHKILYRGDMMTVGRITTLNYGKEDHCFKFIDVQYNYSTLWLNEELDIESHGVDLLIPVESLRVRFKGKQYHSLEARAAIEMKLEVSTGKCEEVNTTGDFTPYITQCGIVNFISQSTQLTSFTLAAFNPDFPKLWDPNCCVYKVTFSSKEDIKCVNGLQSLVIKEIVNPLGTEVQRTLIHSWNKFEDHYITWYSKIKDWTYHRLLIQTLQHNNTRMCPMQIKTTMLMSPVQSSSHTPLKDKSFLSAQKNNHKYKPFSWIDANESCHMNEMEMVTIRDGKDWREFHNMFVSLHHTRTTKSGFKQMYKPTFRDPNIVFIGLTNIVAGVSLFLY